MSRASSKPTASSSFIAGSTLSAGGAIEWLRSIVGGLPQEQLIAEAAKIPPGSHGVVFLPHFGNGPPPFPDSNARGAFLGLTQTATPEVLYRAVLEGVALQSRMMLDGMLGLPGVDPLGTIRMIGGTARNRLFLAIKANTFGRPVVVVDEPEATALGAALFGGIAAGIFPTLGVALAGLDRKAHVIEPDATAEFYAALRDAVFQPILESIRPIDRYLADFAAAQAKSRD